MKSSYIVIDRGFMAAYGTFETKNDARKFIEENRTTNRELVVVTFFEKENK
jgi:hypothetical protein